MLSLSSIKYMTALVNVPDINMEVNFFSQKPFICPPPDPLFLVAGMRANIPDPVHHRIVWYHPQSRISLPNR